MEVEANPTLNELDIIEGISDPLASDHSDGSDNEAHNLKSDNDSRFLNNANHNDSSSSSSSSDSESDVDLEMDEKEKHDSDNPIKEERSKQSSPKLHKEIDVPESCVQENICEDMPKSAPTSVENELSDENIPCNSEEKPCVVTETEPHRSDPFPESPQAEATAPEAFNFKHSDDDMPLSFPTSTENTLEKDNVGSKPMETQLNPVSEEKPEPEDECKLPVTRGEDLDSQLCSNNSSESSSSEEENTGPLIVRQRKETPENEDGLAQSLKRALEERDKQQEIPIEPLHFDENEYASDMDDTSLRARTANDFKEEEIPPALPPKKSKPFPKQDNFQNNPPILHKTNHVPRGRWSDDESDVPSAHRKPLPQPVHPPPDRIIDFSQKSTSHPKSRKKDHGKHRKRHDPLAQSFGHNSRYSEDPSDAFKRQSMISLHASGSPYTHDPLDPYHTEDDPNDDLNKLIKEANNLDIKPYSEPKEDSVDVVYPSYQHRNLPAKKQLGSSYPDAFAKLAINQDTQVPVPVKKEEPEQFSAISRGPLCEFSHGLSKKRRSQQSEILPAAHDPQDGDDEISLEDSDTRFFAPPAEVPKIANTTPYLCEVFPSDYTDFETASEADINPLYRDITPYDTVADLETDWDTPNTSKGNDLNPIVNEDYQICTEINKNHHTFPRRMKGEKPKPKERPSLNMMAIPLTDPSTHSKIQHASLPYREQATLQRHTSDPDLRNEINQPLVFEQMPHIVVTRGPTDKNGGAVEQHNVYNGPQSLPAPTRVKSLSENKPPQIHLSLGQNSGADKDMLGNSNNVRINLLPSEDPNVINLNIRTTSIPAPEEQTIIPMTSFTTPIADPDPSPLQLQPIQPITAISHRLPSAPQSEASDQLSSQHRVVDIEPVIINNGPPPQPDPIFIAPAEPRLYPILQPIVQETPQLLPTVVPVQQEQLVMTAGSPQVPMSSQADKSQQVVQTVAPVHDALLQIENPWDDRKRQLPEARLRHGGDSGIDLTNYEGRIRENRDATSSSEASDYEASRKSSKRRLASTVDGLSTDGEVSNRYIEWYQDKYMKPTCCYRFLKYFIFVLNVLFAAVGLTLLGLGIWGFADLLVNGLEDPFLILLDPIFPVFVIGFFITLVCLNGAVGFFRDSICVIRFFGWCLFLLCIVFIGGGICFWVMKDTIREFSRASFIDLIHRYNTTTRKTASFTLDQIQANFYCCGMSNSTESYNDWIDDMTSPCDLPNSCPLPASCCQDLQKQDQCEIITDNRHDMNCIDAISAWINKNTPLLLGVWLAIIVLFIINFVCIYFMLREIKYLHAIQNKIFAINESESEASSSSDDTTDSEYEEEQRRKRRRQRRRRKRMTRKRKRYHVNKAYR